MPSGAATTNTTSMTPTTMTLSSEVMVTVTICWMLPSSSAPITGPIQCEVPPMMGMASLVVDFDLLPPPQPLAPPARRTMVRGIFSISQIARQLGIALPAGVEVARTFAEIKAAIR